eukprot:GHVH01003270.1.p2 GENE.GHVH01003270.1~~GHVH01003270.1.p2  ORF type:complete len:304 (+),score=42.59 GHVH01003270.1:1969-2880(+)
MSTFVAFKIVDLLHSLVSSRHLRGSPAFVAEDPSNDPLKFTSFAFWTLNCAWVVTLLTGFSIMCLTAKMSASKRHFHYTMAAVQAVALLGYSATIGGYGILPKGDRNNVLIGQRDEFAIHYLFPFICLPPIVYVSNNMAGIFSSEGHFITMSLILSSLYGAMSLFLPRDWLGSMIAVLSVVFAVPYLMALIHTWPSAVRAAPRRVRKLIKLVCVLQVLVLVTLILNFDLAMNGSISVDVENLLLTTCNLLMYSFIPLLLVSRVSVLKDVYSREEYISQTKRSTTLPVPSSSPLLIAPPCLQSS